MPGALRVERVDEGDARRGLDLAAEPRLAARRARRRRARASGCSTSAPRRAGRRRSSARRGRRGREAPGPRARAGGELRRLGATNVRVVNADALELPPSSAASTACSSTRRARASACSPRGPTCAGARSRCRSSSASCCAPRPSACGRAARSSTPSARSTRTRTRRSSTRAGLEVEPLGEEWPQFAHPRRPEFLLTLPHRAPHVRLLHRPAAIIRRMSWRRLGPHRRGRAVALRGRLLAARRAGRGAAARRVPRLPLRRRRRPLHPAGHDGPDRAQVDRAARPRARAACSTAT